MLTSIKRIGEIIDEPKIKVDGKVLLININEVNGYNGIDIEDFDSNKIKKYLYKEGASKGNVSSPFCPITEPKKTFKKIVGWLEQCKKYKSVKNNSEDKFEVSIDKIFEIILENKDKIIDDISEKISEIPKKGSKFLTIRAYGKYVGEYDIFLECIDYFERYKLKSSSSEATCCVCGATDKEVSGKTDVFKFYTIDKPGFITGGFKVDNAWKIIQFVKNVN